MGVTRSEGGTSPKAGFVWERTPSEWAASLCCRREGGEIFSWRKHNFKSEVGSSCFGDAGIGHSFYPLFWETKEGRKSKNRGQKKGKRRILHKGMHSLRNQEIHWMLSLGPWWCPAPISGLVLPYALGGFTGEDFTHLYHVYQMGSVTSAVWHAVEIQQSV